MIDYFFHLVGNFGLAILIVTVIVKRLFFPLANKSYASVAKMKAVQPEMAAIRERSLFSFVAQSNWRTGSHFAGLRSLATTR